MGRKKPDSIFDWSVEWEMLYKEKSEKRGAVTHVTFIPHTN